MQSLAAAQRHWDRTGAAVSAIADMADHRRRLLPIGLALMIAYEPLIVTASGYFRGYSDAYRTRVPSSEKKISAMRSCAASGDTYSSPARGRLHTGSLNSITIRQRISHGTNCPAEWLVEGRHHSK